MDGCIFCLIAGGTGPAHRVYEDDDAVAFLDINPAVDGHTLVIPRKHAADLFDIGAEDASAVMAASVRVAAMMKSAMNVDGINIVHASGAAAWQSVFHFHLHLLPRYVGDDLPVWSALLGRRGDPAALEAAATRIRSGRPDR